MSRLAFLLVLPFIAFSFAAQAAERTIIVLDASGSMWGQIDGKPKLEIAREALRNVLKTVPADTELGLMAYGHREKGSCSDIQLIVPPAKGTEGAISSAVDSMKFLGKTPLSAAVKQAAQDLRYTEEKSTVILITDGLETCEADPCALGKELEQSGVDFTAHVVGFGLTAEEGKQVACLAENTGGKYIQATDATALEDALKQTVAAAPAPEPTPPPAPAPEPAPAPAKVEFNVDPALVLVAGGPEVDLQSSGTVWNFYKKNPDGSKGERVTTEYDAWKGNVEPGDYILEGQLGQAKAEQSITVKADQTAKPALVLNAGRLTIRPFSAPGQKPDDVTILYNYKDGQTSEYRETPVVLPAGDVSVEVKIGAAAVTEKLALAAGQDLVKDVVVGVGRTVVDAFYTAGGEKVDSGDLSWKIYKAAKKIDGTREQVTYGFGAAQKFDLAAGDYIAEVQMQGAGAEQPFTIAVGQQVEVKVPLNAGVLAISAPGVSEIRILEGKKNLQGERAGVTYGYGEKFQSALPAGDYVVVTAAGENKKETPVTVKAGERKELAIP